MEWGDGGFANRILDDGGDATMLATLGAKAEQDPSVAGTRGSDGERAAFDDPAGGG